MPTLNNQEFYQSMAAEGVNIKYTLDSLLDGLYIHFAEQWRKGNAEAVWGRDDDPHRWQTVLAHYAEAKAWAHLYLDTSGFAKSCAVDDPRLPVITARHEAFLMEYAELNERIDSAITDKAMADAIGE